MPLRKQLGTGLGEFHDIPDLCQPRSIASSSPALYSAGRAVVAEQKRAVDLLDIDPAILDGFEGLSVLHETACGLFGIGVGAVGGYFIGRRPVTETSRHAPTRIFPRCPVAVVAPGLIVGLGALSRDDAPCGDERVAGLVKIVAVPPRCSPGLLPE